MKQQESNFKYFVSIMLTLIGLITSGLGGLGVVCVVVLLFSMKKIWDETKAKYSIPNQATFIELSDKVIKLEKQVNKLKSKLKKYKNNDRVLMRTFIREFRQNRYDVPNIRFIEFQKF